MMPVGARFILQCPSEGMLVCQKIIFLSLFLLHSYLPGSGGWEPLLAFMRAVSERHTQRVYPGAVQLSPCSVTVHVCPLCCPLPCVSVTSQRTRLQRPENAEPKPLNYSWRKSSSWRQKLGPVALLSFLELRLCSHCTPEENTFVLLALLWAPSPAKGSTESKECSCRGANQSANELRLQMWRSAAGRPGTGMCWEWQEGDFLGTLLGTA